MIIQDLIDELSQFSEREVKLLILDTDEGRPYAADIDSILLKDDVVYLAEFVEVNNLV